jgi:HPr kinase/phosphorylase
MSKESSADAPGGTGPRDDRPAAPPGLQEAGAGSHKSVSVLTMFEEKREEFNLELLVGAQGMERRSIETQDVFRPGLALAGYTEYFLMERIQIVGMTEISYLKTIDPQQAEVAIERVMTFEPPCFIVAKGLPVPEYFTRQAEARAIPILRTPLDTTPFIHLLTAYLEFKLAPETSLHGTLVDVDGVGLLLVGESGIGKSECALDLVERGHRLVADDRVRIVRRGQGILMGYGMEASDLLQHHLEVRGVGIVDIYSMYGIRSIRLQKRIEVEVELVAWDPNASYERVGLEDKFIELLGVRLPMVTIPVVPGKNISVICEVIAMNHLLKVRGFHPAKVFNQELIRIMSHKAPPIDPFVFEDIE